MKWTYPEELIFIRNRKLPQQKTDTPMTGKLVIISGATSGVGLSSLWQLAKGGAHIAMVARNHEKAERVKQEVQAQYDVQIDIVISDFSDLDSVRKAAKELLEKYDKIDVLINSAGIHSTKRKYTKEGYELVFCVNHLAPFLFTNLLLERLKESAPSRIIQVNSEGHRFNGLRLRDVNWRKRIYTGLRSYGASKTAQLLTVWEMNDQLKDTGVTVNAMHPGDVRTNIGNNNGWLYRFFLRHVTWHFLKDPIVSGESVYYLAASKDMEQVSGKFFHLTIEETVAKHARNRIKGKQLYEMTLDMTGLNKKQGLGDSNEV